SFLSGSFSTAQITPERDRFHPILQGLLPPALPNSDSTSRGGLIHASLPEAHYALTCATLSSMSGFSLKALIQGAFWYSGSLQSRLHPVRGKGRSHLNQFPDTEL